VLISLEHLLALSSPAATWQALALISLEYLLPWSLTGRSTRSRSLSLHLLRVAALIPAQIRLVLHPAVVIASESR
jgi:hypothetical protein